MYLCHEGNSFFDQNIFKCLTCRGRNRDIMQISTVISFLESLADPSLQEHYDNAGLITGNASWECRGIICCLDSTEAVIDEAIEKKANLVIAHHPIVFGGLKRINGKNYVEKTIIRAIKNDIAIYAIHTNLDNVKTGVSGKMANQLGLQQQEILLTKNQTLKKLFVFVPADHANAVRTAVFEAGGGHIGKYSECSFNAAGFGTFKAETGARPFTGEIGKPHAENELKVEVIFPAYLERPVLAAMKKAHPYEEVAYDVISLVNAHPGIGSGIVGQLPGPMEEQDFLALVKSVFGLKMVRHTRLRQRPVHRVALCGGAGSFLINNALQTGADFYISADIKYHEFFDANDRMVVADIGHFESERFTIDLLYEILVEKFPNFAVLKTGIVTNPVYYS